MKEALTQGAENIGLMRIGGSPGSFILMMEHTHLLLNRS